MLLAELLKTLEIVYQYTESLVNEIFEYLEPSKSEEKELQTILGLQLEKHITSLHSSISKFIETSAQTYLEQISLSLQTRLQAKITFREASDQIQASSNLKNIDLSSKTMDLIQESGLFEDFIGDFEQDEKTFTSKLGESFSYLKGDHSIDPSRLIKENKSSKSKESKGQKANGNLIPFQELTRYHIIDAVSVSDRVRTPEFLQALITINNHQVIKELSGADSFENLVPSRISGFLYKYLQTLNPYLEILIKFQRLVGGNHIFLTDFLQVLIKDAANIQERVRAFIS